MQPLVSVIIPCRNEEKTISLLLQAIYDQTFPRDQMEVVIADGMSEDATRQSIQAFQAAHPELAISVVDNPLRHIPAALNTAIRHARGKWIVRLDAHSVPDERYVENSVQALEAGKAEMVGGVWEIRPQSGHWIARSIAEAAAQPVAVGDAHYRFTTQPAYVDTVPFGAFAKDLWEKLGGYDETLLSNEDYEFNTRIRQSGGRVWLDPAIHTVYFARKNLADLARQYWRYGYWKVQMLKRYPGTLRYRQALPPLFVLGLLTLLLVGLFWWPPIALFLVVFGLYLLVLLVLALSVAVRKQDILMLVGVPLAVATMHFAWGIGFLSGLIRPPKGK